MPIVMNRFNSATYDPATKEFANDIEGIVWHHDDGRMVKIKSKDFGIKRA